MNSAFTSRSTGRGPILSPPRAPRPIGRWLEDKSIDPPQTTRRKRPAPPRQGRPNQRWNLRRRICLPGSEV
jgi:hypothetical protein